MQAHCLPLWPSVPLTHPNTTLKRTICKWKARNSRWYPSTGQQAAASAQQPKPVLQATLESASEATIDPAADLKASEEQQNHNVLQNLLAWLVANGVTGIGEESSMVALYQDAQGDRGVIAVQDIADGKQLLRVPLGLAITDVMEEREQQQLVGQGLLWQDRLVAKVLQQVQQGPGSAWHPYIQALPKSVPSALHSFSLTDLAQVQLPETTAAIKEHAGKMSSSWSSCRPDAIGGADFETYCWAHTLVMSRTFGNAAPAGGIGVRMLVPLIDMLNHAGDETVSGLLSDSSIMARDNVRWDVVSPKNSPNGCWEMVLSAKQDIPANHPLLLSYFEGSNDEFLLHYGFVPPSNPHDTFVLFPGITAALEHLWQQDIYQGRSAAELAPMYQQALDAGLAALQEEVAAAAAAASGEDSDSTAADSSSWGALVQALEPIKVASGSRISNALVAALEVLHAGDMAAVEAAVAALAWQKLTQLPTSLLYDLALLVTDRQAQGDQQGAAEQEQLLRHYLEEMVPAGYAPDIAQQLQAALGAMPAFSSSSSSTTAKGTSLNPEKRAKRIVPGPASAAHMPPTTGQRFVTSIQQLPVQMLVEILMDTNAAAAMSKRPQQLQQSEQQQQQQQQQMRPSLPLSYSLSTAVRFRASKKMLLMDVVLAAKVPLTVLQQQTEPAAASGKCTSSSTGLPWQAL